jgi:GT2 family glycosyltransferase
VATSSPLQLSAVVVAYGSEELLRESLGALRIALGAVNGRTELLVVLNRASARSRAELEQTTDVVLIEPGRNLGFAGGVNSAITRSTGDWIALVNDDCTATPTALAEMLAAGEAAADIGSVAAQVRFADRPDVINSAGIAVDVLGIATERLLGAAISESETHVTDVFGASGAAGLYRRRMLDAIGGFDDSFFAYLEDVDVAWRARMGGWRCVYAPRAVVHHHHSASLGHGSPTKHFLVGRNRVRLLAKNATRRQLACHAPRIVAYDLGYVVFATLKTRSIAPLKGRLAGLLHWREDRARVARRPVRLAPASGLRHALDRHRAYSRR